MEHDTLRKERWRKEIEERMLFYNQLQATVFLQISTVHVNTKSPSGIS